MGWINTHTQASIAKGSCTIIFRRDIMKIISSKKYTCLPKIFQTNSKVATCTLHDKIKAAVCLFPGGLNIAEK